MNGITDHNESDRRRDANGTWALRAFEKLPVMVSYWDQSHRNRFSSAAYARTYGVSPEQLLGRHLQEMLGDHLYQLNLPYITAVLNGKPQKFERSIPAAHGAGVRHLLTEYIPDVVEGVVEGFFAQISDVSVIKEAELAARDSKEKIAKNEARLRSILNDQADVISRLTGQGIYLYANEAFLRFFGKSEAELIGSRWQPIVYSDDLTRVTEELATLSPECPLVMIENRVYSSTGEVIWMQFSNRGTFDAQGNLIEIQSVGRDISARKKMEDALKISEARFRTLIDQAPMAIGVSRHGKALYVNRKCLEIFGFDASESLVGKPIGEMWTQESRARIEKGAELRSLGLPAPAEYEEMALRKDGSVFPAHITVTVIELSDGPATVGFLEDISERKRSQELLQESLEQSIRAMSDTVEARDPYTAGHQRRVADLAVAIARELGLDKDRITGVSLAASIHDLGKIKVPAEILAKPGKLSEIEYSLIKQHPETGYEILKDIKFPWPIAAMVYQHHEKLDGSGYPRGLKGDEIILEARILAVADVVEAMESHRPYRSGLGLEAALNEIRRGRGSSYDPQVVDACLTLFRENRFVLRK